jgi:Flp pilus assembly protein TadD
MTSLMVLVFMFRVVFAEAYSIETIQNPSRPDITGGAALIFKRPENPTTGDRKNATANKQRAAADETNDKVEDAIALGNAARDRKPPDFESAEKAYRLAWKLNPRDPRPYLGLGNLYWDQRRYAEAAQAYRDALRYIDRSDSRSLYVALSIRSGSGGVNSKIPDPVAEIRLYFAATLLEEQNPLGAERELRLAAFSLADNAEWNGLFGYALLAQGRYTDALAAYEKAVKLEPLNEKYKKLLSEATQKARETSANDQAITNRLQNTKWEIRDAGNLTIKGICELDANGSVRCRGANSDIALTKARWRVSDGLLAFEGAFKVPFCVGPVRTEKIQVKCYRRDSEINELWEQQR